MVTLLIGRVLFVHFLAAVQTALARALPHTAMDVLVVLVVGLFVIGLVGRVLQALGVALDNVQAKSRSRVRDRAGRPRGAEHLPEERHRGRRRTAGHRR